MKLSISGFSVNKEFIPSHELKVKQTPRYVNTLKENFLNFFVYCDDNKQEILRVGCNKAGIVSFIESKVCVPKHELDYFHKQFLDKALQIGVKRLPESYLANLNDLNLNMGFASWDGVIDKESGDILIVGACYDSPNDKHAFWTNILISPVMLDYNKASIPVESRFNLADLKFLYAGINS